MILILARHETRRLLRGPLLWLLLAASSFLLAYLFLSFIQQFSTSIASANAGSGTPLGVTRAVATPTFLWATLLCFGLLPLFAARLLAEERQKNTWPLLACAPLTGWQITFGKYIGLLLPVSLFALIPLLMSLSLADGTTLDIGLLVSGALSSACALAAFAAAVLYFSSLTREPVSATLLAYGLLMLLMILHITAGKNSAASGLYELSPLNHLTPMLEGRISVADLGYFACFTALFLWLTGRRLSSPAYRSQR